MNTLCEVEPTWGCLDRAPRSGQLGPGPINVQIHLQDIMSEAPMSGVTATLCRKRDQQCANPESSVTSDADGNLVLSVPAGLATAFSAYALLTRADLVPGLYFFNPPTGDDRDGSTIQISTQNTINLLAKQLGVDVASGHGFVFLSARDCRDEVAEGVSFTSDDDAAFSFYSVEGLPSTSATFTNATGFGGFANVRPGSVTISAQIDKLRRPLATVDLLVAPGSITYSGVVPLGN